jgi:prolyl-tRNA synthetase
MRPEANIMYFKLNRKFVMRLSRYFLPLMKETPADAQIISHRLMHRAGLIHKTSAGIYSWLPLGLRVLENIERIVREEQDRIGNHYIKMSTIQPADLWIESGRYDAYGKEMLRIKDRHDREFLYGPTNEEQVTDIVRTHLKSYKDLPLNLYQIQWKFRDEIRPRFGVMRGREFLMKDGYSFDINFESAKKTYQDIFQSYLRTFRRLGLTAIPVQADSGAIGGNLSHEFQILAETGESTVYYDKRYEELANSAHIDFDELSTLYAVESEKHDPATCPVPEDQLLIKKGIEVGHIFYFGTKYSESMGLKVTGSDGKAFHPEMGSYGIGVSRLVGAIIEASHDDKGIIWPEAVAPFKVMIIDLVNSDDATSSLGCQLHKALISMGIDVLYDDRDERPGVKFATADLIGIPYHVIVGKRSTETGLVELKHRKTGQVQEMTIDHVIEKFKKDKS